MEWNLPAPQTTTSKTDHEVESEHLQDSFNKKLTLWLFWGLIAGLY